MVVSGATIDQASTGLLSATGGTGSRIDLVNGVVAGGVLRTASGGVIDVKGGTDVLDSTTPLGGVTNSGSVVIGDTFELELDGTLHNSGSILLQAGSGGSEHQAVLRGSLGRRVAR